MCTVSAELSRPGDSLIVRVFCNGYLIAARRFGGSQAENDARNWCRSLGVKPGPRTWASVSRAA